MARDDVSLPVGVDEIDVSDTHRKVNADAVKRLADSIEQIGLRHPITVKRKGDRYQLVAGLHRLEAYKKLDKDFIPATIVVMTKDEARMWEISENLHRAELTKLERDEQVAEWIELKERVNAVQIEPHKKRGQQPGGISAAAREIGVDETDAKRAVKVASLSDEAKKTARETGLDEHRGILLEAAKEKEPEKQTAIIRDFAARKTAQASKVEADVKARAAKEVAEIIAEYVPGDAWDGIKANLYAAGAANIANALTNITGQSIMDGRYS